jgi:rhodanese-related sulfurtransferase
MVPSCAEGGVLGVLCASIGSIQVNEAIKLLTGIGDPAIGKLVIYDALELEWRKLRVRKDPSCALCGENPTVTGLIDYDNFCGAVSEEALDAAAGSTISVTTLEHMLKEQSEGSRDLVLVDVREPNEYEINQIPGSVLIPKGEFLNGHALEMEYRKLGVRKDPNCAICGDNPTVTELIDYEAFCGAISEEAADAAADSTISVTQLERMLKERESGERDFVLVDVREPNEYEINQIPGSVLIPKGEFLNGNALGQLPNDKPVVLHCKTGVRSAEALAVLKGAGYSDAVHVGGGVVAWVNQVDPSQPSY